MKPATNEELKKFKWAYDKMEEGFIYVLYEGEEIVKSQYDKKKHKKGSTKKISPKTGARFITRAFFCKGCHKFFLVRAMKNIYCTHCQEVNKVELGKKTNSEKYTPNSNKKIPAIEFDKIKLSCFRCASLFERTGCTLAKCESQNFKDRTERIISTAAKHE